MSLDLFAIVTDRIVAELEKGTVPWKKPWTGGESYAKSHTTGKPYSLLNQMLLGGRTGEYLTYKQCVEEGGSVKPGEKASIIVFWKFLENIDEETGEIKQIPFLRYYSVFHISQCAGIAPRFGAAQPALNDTLKPDEEADRLVQHYLSSSGVRLQCKESGTACYSPVLDMVTMPLLGQFTDMPEFYSALFHELTHSTGHPFRLNRLTEAAAFGSESYSREELVAELGSAFLMNFIGLETKSSFQNNAAYINGWLQALRNDKRLIVTAAGKAEKAVEMIMGNESPGKDEES